MENWIKVNRAVATRIRQILDKINMSQYRLELLAGISHSTMMDIMNVKSESCTLKTAIIIIRALGMTVSEFFDDPIFESDDLFLD